MKTDFRALIFPAILAALLWQAQALALDPAVANQGAAPEPAAGKVSMVLGGAWLDALLDHIAGNMALVDDWCARELAGVVVPVKAEATYLKWIDTTGTGLDEEDLMDRLINQQGLLVQAGSDFGAAARGFLRLNLACPRTMVTTAMNRIARVVGPVTD